MTQRWEDLPSMQGSGLWQDIRGATYDAFKTNGELSLSQQRDTNNALANINKALDKHQESLDYSKDQNFGSSHREPRYMPIPEIRIDTDRLADAQYAISDRLQGVLNAQKSLVAISKDNQYGQERLITGQGVTNELLQYLGKTGNQSSVDAYKQREEQLQQFSTIITINREGNQILNGSHLSIDKTRHVIQGLLNDIGHEIISLNHEQTLTRLGVIQALHRMESTYLQTHENEILAYQRNQSLLEELVSRSGLTEAERQARRLWEKAELLRNEGDFIQALEQLKKAYELDEINPNILLSSGVIQSSLGNTIEAANFFIQTEKVADIKSPHMSSYILMNLASNLLKLSRFDHAERVMYKAIGKDPTNREVWFKYAITAWKTTNKKNEAITTLIQLLRLNPVYYRAQIVIHPDLQELRELLNTLIN